jgi:hypothetical protein
LLIDAREVVELELGEVSDGREKPRDARLGGEVLEALLQQGRVVRAHRAQEDGGPVVEGETETCWVVWGVGVGHESKK